MLPWVTLTVRYANTLYKNRSFLSSTVCSNEARLIHLHALIWNLFPGFYWVAMKGEIEGAIILPFRLITEREWNTVALSSPSTHCPNNSTACSQNFILLIHWLMNLFFLNFFFFLNESIDYNPRENMMALILLILISILW